MTSLTTSLSYHVENSREDDLEHDWDAPGDAELKPLHVLEPNAEGDRIQTPHGDGEEDASRSKSRQQAWSQNGSDSSEGGSSAESENVDWDTLAEEHYVVKHNTWKI